MGALLSPNDPDHPHGTLLLVDDEDAVRRALVRLLRRAGHEVFEAATGVEATALLEQQSFEAVLSDISMPGMDGMKLLEIVRVRQPEVPVLLMTGAPDLGSAMSAVEYGAFAYLAKPIELEKLQASVVRAINHFRTATERRRLAESATRRKTPTSSPQLTGQVQPGTVLADRYRLVRLIASGGMGSVFEAARDDLNKMSVAVKVLHPRLLGRADIHARFRREAEVVAALNHPNIVKVFDFTADEEGPAFIVMELLRGRTLTTAIERDPPFSQSRVAFIASQVLSALEAAHAIKVIHRDLKPDNLFLTAVSGIGDLVKVLDFGIAKLLENADSKLTETGTVLGTPAYMAPESARGERPLVAGDIYAVGCVMYEALTQRAPFVGANYNSVLHAIQNKQPAPITDTRPEIAPEFAAVIERAMSKDPAGRFPSARAMADAIEPWLGKAERARRASIPALASAPTVFANAIPKRAK